MASRPVHPIRVKSDEALLIAARAVFQRNPGASLDDVAAAAGVGRATLFRHFKTRTDLQRAVFVRALVEVQTAVRALDLRPAPGAARTQLSLLLRTLLGVGGELRYILSVADLFNDPDVVAAADGVYALVDPVFAAAVEQGVLRNDLPLSWLRATAEAVLYAAWFEIEAGTLARAGAAELVEQTVLSGIGGPGGTVRAASAADRRATTPRPRRPRGTKR